MSKFGEKFVSGLGGALSGVAGGFIGSAGSKLIDGLFGSDPNKQNKEIMQMQNQFNAQEAQKNRDFQLQMFNRTNEYNSPKAQMQRFMEAGLNPDLMYGNGASSIAAQSPSGSQASGSSPIAAVDMQQRAANVALTQAQTRLIEHQADNLDADTGKKDAETAGILTFNEFQPMLLDGYIRMNNVNIDLGKAKTDWTRADELKLYNQSIEISTNVGVLNETMNKLRSEVQSMQVDNLDKIFRMYLDSEQFKINYQEALSRIGLNNAKAHLSYKEAQSIAMDLYFKSQLKEKGINPYIDEHNESVWRKFGLMWNGYQAQFNYGLSETWDERIIQDNLAALKNGTISTGIDAIGAIGTALLGISVFAKSFGGKPPKIGFK